jgi:ribosomal protein S27E
MNFFYKISSAINRFLYGRNGFDALGIAALIASFVLSIFRWIPLAGFIIWLVQTAMLVYVVFRIMSKNIAARRAENLVFKGILDKIKNEFSNWKIRHESAGTHKFFKCPGCKNTLRVPKGKGKVYVTCPRCGERFVKNT